MKKGKIFALIGIVVVSFAIWRGVSAQQDTGDSTTVPPELTASATVPTTPSFLRLDATPVATMILLRWNDNSSDETSFNIDRKLITDTSYPENSHLTQLGANVTNFADITVVPSQRYHYRVQACNAAGCSDYSNQLEAATLFAPPAPAPVFSCTSLGFMLTDNKATYTVGDTINYSYTCRPPGSSASLVSVQLLKPDGGISTTNTALNTGASTQQASFSTSNLVAGSYTVRACLSNVTCVGVSYSIPVTLVNGSSTPAPTPLPTFPSAPTTSTIETTTTTATELTPEVTTTATTQLPTTFDTTQPTTPVVATMECKPYLATALQTSNVDKVFVQEVKRSLDAIKHYSNRAAVQKDLDDAQAILTDVERSIKIGKCEGENPTILQDKMLNLHNTIFPELSEYRTQLQNLIGAEQCRNSLDERATKLSNLAKKVSDPTRKTNIQNLIDRITSQSAEFDSRASEVDYNLSTACSDFSKVVQADYTVAVRRNDQKLNQIIDKVVAKKLQPVFGALNKQLEENGKNMDELLVKVADFQRTMEGVTKNATTISDNITTSYSALTTIDPKFQEQKTQITASKDRLIPLLNSAATLLKSKACVQGVNRETLTQKLGEIASTNWLQEKAAAVEQHLNLFMADCNARNLTTENLKNFSKNIDDLSAQNNDASYRAGLTFDRTIPTNSWYYSAYQDAYRAGYVTQGRPEEDVTAQDALLMIMRANGATGLNTMCTLGVTSVQKISDYAICAANQAAEKGLSLPTDMTKTIKRAQIAQWISRWANLPAGTVEWKAYPDVRNAAQDQKDSIASVITAGIMVGDSTDGKTFYFRPQSNVSRAALVVIVQRMGANVNVR